MLLLIIHHDKLGVICSICIKGKTSCPKSFKVWGENVSGQPTRPTELDAMGALIYVDNRLNAMGVRVAGFN
ncbi:hypothetical protein HanXRQr2_Chr13g0579291 [Helianthus annuus]|uniref:Uncharacterized protein n=1 Tax=Helianthus annuus TaxID=4232 RepID=A0A9K3EEX7_HELAN|nr:hypothetical protein HanXRQr2_Chr13g0579291 [Helianthus annuus]